MVLAGLFLTAGSLQAAAVSEAEAILDLVGRPAGLVHLAGCGKGDLAIALLEANETLCVHGQDADYGKVQTARERADEKGFFGKRVWFDQGDFNRLLPVTNSCDLVIITGLVENDLTPALAQEITRILHPWYGTALLAGSVTDDQLLDWGRAFSAPAKAEPRLSQIAARRFLVIKKAALEGADNWTHFWHGPDNNAVSTDTVYCLPETVQWTGKPYDGTRIDLPIVADGRLFMLWNGHLLDMTFGEAVLPGEEVTLKLKGWETVFEGVWEEQRGPLLEARASGSGVRLWSKRMSPAMWLQTARSVVVASQGRLLVGDGGTLIELDQATGKELRRVDMKCEEIKWIAAAGEYVCVLGGSDFNRFPKRMRRLEENVVPFRSSGMRLTVLDRESLAMRWQELRDAERDAFDPRSPAIAANRLFICTERGRAEAYEIKNGRRLWEKDTGIEHGMEVGFLWDRVSRHPVSGYAVAGLYILAASDLKQCAVLSQEDGRPLWELPRGAGPYAPIPLGFMGLVWFNKNGLDPLTGRESRREEAVSVGGCGHVTAAPQGIIGLSGLCWDAIKDRAVSTLPGKSACGSGQFVANGLIWRIANGCDHIPEWRGFNVRGPAETNLPPAGPRLVRGVPPAIQGGEATGWTTYRANAARSSSVAVPIAEDAGLLWSVSPFARAAQNIPDGGVLLGATIAPVPPVTSGNTVVVGCQDGAIEALDLRSGQRLWRARTGGRIQSSLTIWEDRVFAGSADGFVYAFALDDGRELWRLRVAPEAGRIMLFDQLGSRWPVLGTPMVVNGRLLALAGFMECLDGLCAVAADAVSGEMLWERTGWQDAEGETLNVENRLGGTGQFCWDDEVNEAVYSAGEGLPIRLSIVDGAARAAYARGRIQKLMDDRKTASEFVDTHYKAGQDIGKLGSGWMLKGGTRMLYDKLKGYQSEKKVHFFSQENNGDGRFPVLKVEDSVAMPCWDEKDVLFPLKEDRKKTPVSIALYPVEGLNSLLVTSAVGQGKNLEWLARDITFIKQEGRFFRWRTDLSSGSVSPVASALTANAALVLVENERSAQYALIAFRRTDGQEMWEVKLPSAPVADGLAVASDGTCIVALKHGTILGIGGAH
ncbi:MAG: PQQ-binding-like beta-propeller repeat protein [Planctomycetota bacterium]